MSMTDYSGWAIRRNGSCVGEVDCGQTRAPYHACCPSSTECPSQYNVACCPFGQNCTAAAVETPRCANGSWAMFDNAGYFCCEKGYIGYNYYGSDGCSKSGAVLPDGALPLAEISQVRLSSSSTAPTTTTSSSLSTASPTASPTSDAQSDSDNPSPVGPIVGGVVGGVAFLGLVIICLWFVRRRKARVQQDVQQSFMLNQEPPPKEHPPGELPSEPRAAYPPQGPPGPPSVSISTINEKFAPSVKPSQMEIDGTPRAELPDAATTRYELA
ncbi:uncharacterized protein F4812DRAFT_426147 [Daldinia caldariorum]|uniref:uncharacterized protein n=1 Tax=Daldinia caldariorum TaxID=326644 RepID=UPI002007F781|nr:uncharacterized protein F4812DRAFT_426147 [Daldinia caldariorum]KAI1468279.1 hypothetical protein F4812DRAFT_426147 [Daldinia caldariorum]